MTVAEATAVKPKTGLAAKAEEAAKYLRETDQELDGLLNAERKNKGRLPRQERSRMSELLRTRRAAKKHIDRYQGQLEAKMAKEREKTVARERKAKGRTIAKVTKAIVEHNARELARVSVFGLPAGAMPSKAASTDQYSSMAQGGWVVREGAGEKARLVLVVTDGKKLARLPLTGSAKGLPGPSVWLPLDVLKAVEKAGAFRLTKKGTLQPCSLHVSALTEPEATWSTPEWPSRLVRLLGNVKSYDVRQKPLAYRVIDKGIAYDVPQGKNAPPAPKHLALMPKPPAKTGHIAVSLNAKLLLQLAEAITESKEPVVTLVLDTRAATKLDDGRRVHAKAIRVSATGTESGPDGVLMPVNRRIG